MPHAFIVTPGPHQRGPSARHLPSFRRAVKQAATLPARALLGLIALYQRTLSPVLPALFGPACGCRFSPSCSHYAAGAVRAHGALAGAWLAAGRLLKCTPLHPGGFDPVPPSPWRRRPGRPLPSSQAAGRPGCVRVVPTPLARGL